MRRSANHPAPTNEYLLVHFFVAEFRCTKKTKP